jgi:hypothetical protein
LLFCDVTNGFPLAALAKGFEALLVRVTALDCTIGDDVKTFVNKFTIPAILVKPLYGLVNDLFFFVNIFIGKYFFFLIFFIKHQPFILIFVTKKQFLNIYILFIYKERVCPNQ